MAAKNSSNPKRPAQARATSKTDDSPKERNTFSGEALPRRTLEQAVRVPEILHLTFAGKPATRTEITRTLGIGVRSANTHYLFASAQSYGLVVREVEQFSLLETGRKIVAPTYDGEEKEARLKAVLTPSILSKFYTDYNGHQIPGAAHFPNVLENRFGVPRDRVEEAIQLLLDNARFVGILREASLGEQPRINLSITGDPGGSSVLLEERLPETGGPEPRELSSLVADGDWDRVCFYITPIGEDASEHRRHADMMLRHLLEPVAQQLGLKVVRADKIERAGIITQQIFEHLMRSRICVADLSFTNPNAFYELGVRHVFMRPTIQVIRKGDPIPFDVSLGRTIVIDTSDIYTVIDRVESARRELLEQMKAIVESRSDIPGDDNPVHAYLPGIKIAIPR